ncbi:DUF4185 domain-containing protein [Myxococcota bacterium]|nr:DUF4185 domain-containing protein [Myxococcota bacterium]
MHQKTTWILATLCSYLAAQTAMATDVAVTVEPICNLPQPWNNGSVVGHDVGFSNAEPYEGYHYFFFGDTYVDGNANGVLDPEFDFFRAGTFVARTNDTNPDNCIDLDYKTDINGRANRLIPQYPSETFVWPEGSIVTNESFYTYYGAWTLVGDYTCEPIDDQNSACNGGHRNGQSCSSDTQCKKLIFQGSGLAEISTGAAMNDTRATRIGGYFFSDHGVMHPLLASEMTLCGDAEYVHLFSVNKTSDDDFDPYREVHLVRVLPNEIEDASKYLYYRFSRGIESWVTDFSAATPIYTSNDYASSFQVHFDTQLNKYRATYSCGFGASSMCTATANHPGNQATALRGGWSPGQEFYDCPGGDWARCYQVFTQTQYGTGATKYVTAAKNWQDEYHIALRKVTFGEYSYETGPTSFTPLDACRIVDTRLKPNPYGVPRLPAGGAMKVTVSGSCGVAASARAVALNVVPLETAAEGRILVYPRDAVRPEGAASVEFNAGVFARANNMIVRLSADGSGEIEIFNESAGDVAELIIDVSGYFQ